MKRSAQTEQDLEHLRKLQGSKAFNDYFLRRLRERQARILDAVMDQDDLAPEEREIRRRIWKEYREILAIIDTDARILEAAE